jgi:uncharacterized protein
MRGALFEALVVSEIFKYNYNHNEMPHLYFWRDVQGHEIDVIIEKSFNQTMPIEIKAGMTVTDDFFKGLVNWQEITGQYEVIPYVVYGGNENLVRKKTHIFTWKDITNMLQEIYVYPQDK